MQNFKPSFLPSPRRVFFAITIMIVAAIVGVIAWIEAPNLPRGSGVALVGGHFEMLNQDGVKVTEKDFAGKPMLMFFGYTYCPDVCPTELQVMAAALDQLGDVAKDVQPVFISIDPERDTPEKLGEYLKSFDPRFVGLTGGVMTWVLAMIESRAAPWRSA